MTLPDSPPTTTPVADTGDVGTAFDANSAAGRPTAPANDFMVLLRMLQSFQSQLNTQNNQPAESPKKGFSFPTNWSELQECLTALGLLVAVLGAILWVACELYLIPRIEEKVTPKVIEQIQEQIKQGVIVLPQPAKPEVENKSTRQKPAPQKVSQTVPLSHG